MASTLQSISTLPAFHIYYPVSFLTQACPCTQQLLASCIAWLNSGLSRTKAPLSQSSILPLSQPFPTGRCQKALFATGKAVVVTPSFARLSFDITGLDEPSVRSKVAAAIDSGSETPVE
ncbi:hypothetical protein BU17DRAFT_78992 [Hysterangium stoloniferum]|nr:hypothetical protein BU17DRAFT_78992 [Hysterangium stoloniferum]